MDTTYIQEYEERLVDKMLLQATQNNSIRIIDDQIDEIDKSVSEQVERHLDYESTDETLFNEIIARPNLSYDLPHMSEQPCSTDGQFLKGSPPAARRPH